MRRIFDLLSRNAAAEQFSLAGRGAGGCSAGTFDLIEADKEIQKVLADTLFVQ